MPLVESFYANESEAFQTLYSIAMAVVIPRLPPKFRTESEDVAQECLIEVFTNKPKVQADGQLKAYTIKVALGKTADFCRHRYAQKRGSGNVMSLEEANAQEHYWTAACPLEEALHRLSLNELRIILANLSKRIHEHHRVILHDYYFGGLTHEQIAAKRNINPKAVGTYISRGLARLRTALMSLPELKEELAHHIEGTSNVRLLLPLIGLCHPEELYDSPAVGAVVRYQHADEGLQAPTATPKSIEPPPVEDPDEPSFVRIMAEDKQELTNIPKNILERLRARFPVIARKASPLSQTVVPKSESKGCMVVVFALVIIAIACSIKWFNTG